MVKGECRMSALAGERPARQVLRDYLMLTKPRIVLLLMLTGLAGMWVAAGGPPPPGLTTVTMVGLGMACGAANAINMWYDRDIDAVMKRTQKRPLPGGRLSPARALWFGVTTGVLSFLILATVNLLTACLAAAGLLFYVLVYTMWLKRSTVHNIVIGGAAGAVPPLVGWAAVTGTVDWAALAMFLVVFVWTPPHFWALALFRGEDYARAGVPMLPVVQGERAAKWQILLYSVLLIPAGVSLYFTGRVGALYLVTAVASGCAMVAASVRLLREQMPRLDWAYRTYGWSLLYLTVIFLAMVVDVNRV